ncbi:urease accessory protein UreF [Nakamurella sp. YIM 132087]|uniref:Urease accessory protein UreF n=2 Tax=Nakamurella alba TaxID=2665158 RepID=A0A7K1FRY9_9ACTN|nr:urease accessory protein UreF [Nakamurella alba]
MLLADSRLPTGAHTQSGGLEPALLDGMPESAIDNLLRVRLATVTLVEAGTAVVARSMVLRGGTEDLRRCDTAWRARTASAALRENATVLGRGYLRLLQGLWPDAPAVIAASGVRNLCRAVVLGVAAAAGGLDAGRLARLIGYDDVQSVCAAALKLAPADPVAAARRVLALDEPIDEMACLVEDLEEPEEIPAAAAPMIERWAEQHAVAERRLFRA